MPLLVRTPSPYSNESLFGFVLRVAEANGYDTPRHVWSVAEIPRGLEQAPGFPVERLAAILGQSPESLRPIAYRKRSDRRRSFKILDQLLGDDLRDAPLRLKRSTICPRCASDGSYIEAFWDLTVAVACPTHKCVGLAACPVCAKPLSLIRPGLLECTCGASLAEADLAPADPALAELMAIVHARLHERSNGNFVSNAGLPAPQLMSMTFSSLIRMIAGLGRQALLHDQNSYLNGSLAPGKTATILSDWPNNYHRFLSELGGVLMQERPDAMGLRKQFGRFYTAMFKNRVFSAEAGFLRDEFIRFGHEHWGRAYIDAKFFGGGAVPDDSRFMTMTQVARRFRIWKPTMQRMIADGTLVTKRIGTGASARTLIDLMKSKLPRASTGLMSARNAAAELEIPVSVLNELRNRGVFKATPHCGRAQAFHADDVEAFRIEATELPVEEKRHEGISISELMRLKLRGAEAKAEIIAAAFASRVAIVGRAQETVGGLVLDADQVDKLILNQRCETQCNLYTRTQAAKATGLDQSTIAVAVKSRLLESKRVGGTSYITRESVDEFNATYVTLSTLARRLHTSSACLQRICGANRIAMKKVGRANREIPQAIVGVADEAALIALWERSPSGRRRRSPPSCTERVREYLRRLENSGERLPRRAGRPCKIKIAQACGMSRERIYDNAEIAKLIADFDKLERSAGAATRPIDALRQYLHDAKKSGTSLPLWGGRPNKLLIAQACGFSRQEFSRDPALLAELRAYAKVRRPVASQHS